MPQRRAEAVRRDGCPFPLSGALCLSLGRSSTAPRLLAPVLVPVPFHPLLPGSCALPLPLRLASLRASWHAPSVLTFTFVALLFAHSCSCWHTHHVVIHTLLFARLLCSHSYSRASGGTFIVLLLIHSLHSCLHTHRALLGSLNVLLLAHSSYSHSCTHLILICALLVLLSAHSSCSHSPTCAHVCTLILLLAHSSCSHSHLHGAVVRMLPVLSCSHLCTRALVCMLLLLFAHLLCSCSHAHSAGTLLVLSFLPSSCCHLRTPCALVHSLDEPGVDSALRPRSTSECFTAAQRCRHAASCPFGGPRTVPVLVGRSQLSRVIPGSLAGVSG